MVATTVDLGSLRTQVVITPYAPMSSGASILLFVIVSTPIIGAAVVSGLLGNWYAMPASLAMVLVLGLALRSGYQRTQVREVVSLCDDDIAVERGHARAEQRVTLPLPGAELRLSGAATDHGHLVIRSNGREEEVGGFLDARERRELAEALQRLLGDGHALRLT